MSSLETGYASPARIRLHAFDRDTDERLPFGVCLAVWVAMSAALWALILWPFFA
jgi:hypothetical protein